MFSLHGYGIQLEHQNNCIKLRDDATNTWIKLNNNDFNLCHNKNNNYTVVTDRVSNL